MKISNKLSFSVFASGITILILLSFVLYKFNYESVLTSQSNITKSIADEISDNIEHILSEKVKTALTLANSNTIIQALEESIASYADLSDEKREVSISQLNEKWKSTKDPADNFILEFTDNKTAQFLKKQQTLFKDEYGEIFLTNKFGALVASTAKLSTFAHGHKYWWLGSYANGEGAVFFDDRGYDDSVGGYVLGLVVPIKKGTQIIGILKCNLNILDSINKVISSVKDNLTGELKLTRSGGMILFEEGFEPLSTQIPDNIFRQLKNNDQGIVTINDSKEKYLVGFSQIKLTKNEKGYVFGGTFESIDHQKGNKGESWYVLYYRQMSAIQAPVIKSLKSIVFTGFVIIVFLLLVSYLFGRKIAKPLMMLQEAAKRIGKGTFEGSIDISQDDELGDLAHSFRVMFDKLQRNTTSIGVLNKEIVERKQAEKLLQKERDRAMAYLDIASVIIVSLNRDQSIAIINKKGCEIFGYDESEVIGKNWIDNFLPEKDKESTRAVFLKIMAGDIEPVKYYESHILTKEKKERLIAWSNSVLRNDKGEIIATLSSGEDITDLKQAEAERKKLENQLLQAQKMESVGRLAGGVAHDYNNALSVIIGYTELAMMDTDPSSELQDSLSEILKAATRAKDITRQLLAFARKQTIAPVVLDLNNSVESMLKMLRRLIGEDIDLAWLPGKNLVNVKIDPAQIDQILANLCVNARDAIKEVGKITIETNTVVFDSVYCAGHSGFIPGEFAQLSVTDNGCGMNKEILDDIFEPFFTTKPVDKGTGLGLSTVYGIVKQNKGFINVYSEPDQGTTIKIYLPRNDSKITDIQEEGTERIPQGHGEMILMVEDDLSILKLVEKNLSGLGYTVLAADTPKGAMRLAEEHKDKIHLLITDVIMPEMNGRDLVNNLQSLYKSSLKCIFMSGYTANAIAHQGVLDQGVHFIQKPFSTIDLAKIVRKVLDE